MGERRGPPAACPAAPALARPACAGPTRFARRWRGSWRSTPAGRAGENLIAGPRTLRPGVIREILGIPGYVRANCLSPGEASPAVPIRWRAGPCGSWGSLPRKRPAGSPAARGSGGDRPFPSARRLYLFTFRYRTQEARNGLPSGSAYQNTSPSGRSIRRAELATRSLCLQERRSWGFPSVQPLLRMWGTGTVWFTGAGCTRWRRRARTCQRPRKRCSMSKRLILLYAAALCLLLNILVPPFQNPDEPQHFRDVLVMPWGRAAPRRSRSG